MSTVAPRSILNPAGPLVRRRRVDRLSAPQLAALRQAVAGMQSDGSYRELADLYAGRAGGSTYWFLGWNRAYLRMFEAAMLEQDGAAALPWWDWTQQHEVPRAFRPPTEDQPNPLGVIELPSEGRIERGLAKASPTALPTQADLSAALALEDFHAFSGRIEELHNRVHAWVGRPLDAVMTAAFDPLFWSLQATVDRAWRLWQQRHPDAGPTAEEQEVLLDPFGLQFGEVLDTRALGYDYEEDPWRPVLPGYISDAVGADPVDHLGIEPEVEALCWVIAARDTVPPLSVGLFGDWGSGKTTFMALMQARIRDLCEQSQKRPESPWCGNVKQISFNAWTYADDNLWASLVTDIFTALAAPARYEPEAAEGDPVGMLATIARRRHAAETRQEEATARIKVAERRLEELPDSSGELAREVLVGAPAPGGEPAAMADADFVKDVRKAAGEALGDDAAKAVDDAVLSVGVFATLLARLRALGRLLTGRGTERNRALAFVVLAVLLVAAVFALGLQWESILAALAAVASVAGAVKPLLDAEKALTSGRQEVEDRVDAERRQEREALLAARAERDAAHEELARIASGRVVHDYFADRATSADYRERLGLLSTVRRDFGDLRGWLRDGDRPGPDVDRIVLYVDDLDRCPADRVVEVLEAVHLLLALDLFVVVVGVDPRWLLGSLEHHYEAQFAPRGNRPGRLRWRTTPQDFLEKIFQIPFSLRPMDGGGFERLVGELLPLSERSLPVASPAANAPVAANASPDVPSTVPEPAYATPEDLALEAEEPDPAGLHVRVEELGFLAQLAELVPTPRAAKRLANTYRLLRAPLDQNALDALVTGEHRAVLTLLAALVGAPGAANQAFAALLAEPPDVQWTDFLGRLQAAPVRTETRQLATALLVVTARTGLSGELRTFQSWTPRVARYSFETSRIAPEPMPRTA